MIILNTTSDLLKLVTGSSAVLNVHASYLDNASGTLTSGRKNTSINSATTTNIVLSPASSTERNVLTLIIHNTDASVANLITLEHFDGSTTAEMLQYNLLAGETLQYFNIGGFCVFDTNGNIKIAAASNAGRFLKVTVLTAGSSFTTGNNTNSILICVVAGGGQGGGGVGATNQISLGGGGSCGGYAEKLFAVSPNTAYSYSIGSGGSTSTGATTGQDGGNTTFTVGATTVTANGGKGGLALATGTSTTQVLGGTGPAVSTNGDLNSGGDPGSPGARMTGTQGSGGRGGSGPYGAGGAGQGNTSANGDAGIGFGAGGGGACANSSTSRNGGAGAGGCVVVFEFS